MSDPTPPPAPAVPPAPAKSGNRTLIIVLCVIGGLILLMGGCAVACTLIVGKKAKEFAEMSEQNPAYAGLTMLASFSPDVEIISKDADTGIVKLRNKKTNETVTVDTTKYTADNVAELLESIAAGKGVPVKPAGHETPDGDNGIAAPSGDDAESISPKRAAALAENLKTFPAYLPAYPGATTLQAKVSTALGARSFEYAAQTKDKPAAVVDYYEKKLTAAGFMIVAKNSETNDFGPVVSLNAASQNPAGTIALEVTSQENGQVEISLTGALLAKE